MAPAPVVSVYIYTHTYIICAHTHIYIYICHRDHSENMNPRPIRTKSIAKSQYALQGAVGPLVDENGAAMLLFGRLKTLKTHEEIKIHKELLFFRSTEGNQGSDP